jgi:hypothetical protein
MSNEAYRERARQCVRLSENVGPPSMKATLLKMAQAWLHLYSQSEKNSHTDLVYETPPRPLATRDGSSRSHEFREHSG